jgi:hypothetical protein
MPVNGFYFPRPKSCRGPADQGDGLGASHSNHPKMAKAYSEKPRSSALNPLKFRIEKPTG